MPRQMSRGGQVGLKILLEANRKQIEASGLSFILGARISYVPYLIAQWRREYPGLHIPDGQAFTQPRPAGPNGGRCHFEVTATVLWKLF